MAQKLTLGYWNIRGRAQPVRYLLEYLEVPYEEKRYSTQQEWEEDYSKDPIKSHILANLPYIKDQDKWIYESQALYIYLAHKAKKPELLGSTPDEEVSVFQVTGVLEDFYRFLWEIPDEQTQEQKNVLFKEKVLKFVIKLNKLLQNRKWAAGDNITIVDFLLFEAEYTLKSFNQTIYEDQKNLQRHHDQFANLPQIKVYLESDRFIKE
uniref:glutathione transferase n=1 Tax=Paramecium caudatum TaxID=5885 RepID=A0A077JC26_PARCA|nr:glutathione S-transferase [Paramecium caudatum]